MIEASQQTKLEKIQALKESYCAELPPCLNAIAQLWRDLCSGAVWSVDLVEKLKQKTHLLAGSAGMFGMMDISRVAGAVEEQMVLWNRRPDPQKRPTPESIQRIDALMTALRPSAETAPTPCEHSPL